MSHLPSQKRRRTDAVSSYRDELLDSDEEDDSRRITEWVATTSRHVSAHVTRRKHNTSYFSGVDLPTVAQSSFYGNDKDLETDIYAQAEQLDPAPSGFEEDGQGIDDDDSEDDSDGDDNEQDDDIYIADYLASVNGQSKTSKRTKALLDWVPHRNALLDELHRHDGRAPISSCFSCLKAIELPYRCIDCFSSPYKCAECICEGHSYDVLHRIELWDGSIWKRSSLCDVGLVIQLGHAGDACPATVDKKSAAVPFTVISSSGIHTVKIVWCTCSNAIGKAYNHYVQVLRARWFPASRSRPATAVTFECLNLFHLLTTQGKVTGYDFYKGLAHLTDNTELNTPPKRYEEFMRVARLWRHLKLLKRGGIGLLERGVDDAKLGSCAVACPACPHPDSIPRNPSIREEGMRNSDDKDLSWLDSLIVMLDCNFRLKSKDRSISSDPALGSGLAYYVEEDSYQAYLKDCPEQVEVNYCDSGLHAVDHANSRGGDLYNASGVGACQCRHQMVRANGVGDLQKGERYANVDYIFWSALLAYAGKNVIISYDIICQWYRNLEKRAPNMPAHLAALIFRFIMLFLIPKFHITAHGPKCQSIFSFNFRRNMARTDGENIERGWAWMNPASLSTREMGPGARRDTLDCQWSAWNWRILVRQGVMILRHFYEAVAEARDKRLEHEQFTKTFSTSNTDKWTEMVREWNEDPFSAPNPYEEIAPSETLGSVRKELNNEEDSELQAGVLPLHATSATHFLNIGLDLEEQQRAISLSNPSEKVKAKPTKRNATFDEKERNLRRQILLWFQIQQIYMPCVAALRERDRRKGLLEPEVAPPHTIRLYLPSSLGRQDREAVSIAPLADKERRLRHAQCMDALLSLRKRLRVGAMLFDRKHAQVAGTGTRKNTRMQALIDRYKTKENRDAECYREARKALERLDPNGTWKKTLLPLRPEDVRAPFRGQVESKRKRSKRRKNALESEGTRVLSWIWKTTAQSRGDDATPVSADVEEGLRVEWCKSLARAERWEEEVDLLREEMRRVICFLDFEARRWRALGTEKVGSDSVVTSGFNAYAEKQARLREALAMDFAAMWLAGIRDAKLADPKSWPTKYLSAVPKAKQAHSRLKQNKIRMRVVEYVAPQEIDDDDDDDDDYSATSDISGHSGDSDEEAC